MRGVNGTPALLGRERESSELYDALALALKGGPQTVLVGGDAGIGKTTLVSDLADRARELGFSVVWGHCLDIDAGIAFGAVIEAVGELVARLEDLDARPNARRMRTLLDPDVPRSQEPFRVLEDLRQTVLEAADAGPLMLVLEDLHWAGRSTLDFAVALASRGRGRLLFMLTVRQDDLHRRHPARKALADISRVPGARHVDLNPLDRESIAAIVTRTSGGSADPMVVRSVLERAEGNPLYAEELVAAGEGIISDHLTDLFLARVDALADAPRALIRIASVDGTRVDTQTLAEVAGVDRPLLDASLRELLDANLLRGAGDSLAFRHGLLREAVYDDLLPDERTRTHTEFAAVLQARADEEPGAGLPLLSRLAFHWDAARDLSRSMAASVRAGLAAAHLGAAEEVTHRERALALWDRVPDAETVTGLTRVELVVLVGESAWFQNEPVRAHTLLRSAVDMIDPDTDPLLASRVYSTFARSCFYNEDSIGAQEATRRALDYAGDAPSEELARALVSAAGYHMRQDDVAVALATIEQAAEVARTVGCEDVLLNALSWRADALYRLGRVTEALTQHEQVVAATRRTGHTGSALYEDIYLTRTCMRAGQIERALALATRGHDEALALGLVNHAAGFGFELVMALIWLGRLDEAQQRVDALCGRGLAHEYARGLRCELLLARGDADTAAPLVREEADEEQALDIHSDEQVVMHVLSLAAMRDDGPAALDAATSYLIELEVADSPLIASSAARIAFQALALTTSVSAPSVDELLKMATRQLERAKAALTGDWCETFHGVQLALAEGYAAKVASEPAIGEFRKALALAEPCGAFFALEPRLELAEELLAHGGRDEGRELLVDCWTTAHEIGAGGLERRASKLATRTRVPLPESASNAGPLSRLTPREREILDRLATGATNQAIADDLVISPKTVSVHVSNLLAKLGVENRGAAAAVARRHLG